LKDIEEWKKVHENRKKKFFFPFQECVNGAFSVVSIFFSHFFFVLSLLNQTHGKITNRYREKNHREKHQQIAKEIDITNGK
jgi:hypothetical protein